MVSFSDAWHQGMKKLKFSGIIMDEQAEDEYIVNKYMSGRKNWNVYIYSTGKGYD